MTKHFGDDSDFDIAHNSINECITSQEHRVHMPSFLHLHPLSDPEVGVDSEQEHCPRPISKHLSRVEERGFHDAPRTLDASARVPGHHSLWAWILISYLHRQS